MPYSPLRMAGPTQPATTDTTLFTVPTAHTYIVTEILLANTTAGNATVTVGVNGITAAFQIIPAITLGANSITSVQVNIPMAATDVLHALQGTASAITVTVSGSDVT